MLRVQRLISIPPARFSRESAGGASLRQEDFADVIVDDIGRTSVVLLEMAGLFGGACRAALLGLLARGAPLQEALADVCSDLTALGLGARGGAAILRFSPDATSIEIWSAGLPPVLCIDPDGRMLVHAGACDFTLPCIRTFTAIPGSAILLASRQATGGTTSVGEMEALGQRIGLLARPLSPPGEPHAGFLRILEVGDARSAMTVFIALGPARERSPHEIA